MNLACFGKVRVAEIAPATCTLPVRLRAEDRQHWEKRFESLAEVLAKLNS